MSGAWPPPRQSHAVSWDIRFSSRQGSPGRAWRSRGRRGSWERAKGYDGGLCNGFHQGKFHRQRRIERTRPVSTLNGGPGNANRFIRPGNLSLGGVADHAALDQLPDGGMIGGQALPVARHATEAGSDLPGMQEAALPGVRFRRETPAAEIAMKKGSLDDHDNAPRHASGRLLPN